MRVRVPPLAPLRTTQSDTTVREPRPRPEHSAIVTHVITEPCIGVKDGACTDVCPVDCIHGDEDSKQLFINPDDCIDCQLCVEACPVDACFAEDDVPEQWVKYLEINARYFGVQPSGSGEESA